MHRIEPAPGVLAAGLCRHRFYRFTCDEFDALFERSEGRCEICRKPGMYGHPLQIDHDHDLGLWAVRGLLCPGCNSYELPYRRQSDAMIAYLNNPWHRQLAQEAGVPPDGHPEPGLGGLVVDRMGRRHWARSEAGWLTLHRDPISWADLVRKVGPHNVLVIKTGKPQPSPPTRLSGALRAR